MNLHSISAELRKPDGVEMADDIRVQISGPVDFVQQLGSDGSDIDDSAGVGMLGDDR